MSTKSQNIFNDTATIPLRPLTEQEQAKLAKHVLHLDGQEGGERANFNGAKLDGANFNGAKLREANFRKADLEGADLGGSDLRGAYLGGANLRGAKLRGAKLDGAYLTDAKLDGADMPENWQVVVIIVPPMTP